MSQLSKEQLERVVKDFGSGVQGLEEELLHNLEKLLPFERYESDAVAAEHSIADREVSETVRKNLDFETLKIIPNSLERIIIGESPIRKLLPSVEESPAANERIVAAVAGARPVARIRNNQITTEFIGTYPFNEALKKLIEDSAQFINPAIPSVGRIEVSNSDYIWAGTGWVIADEIIVTNRHVADVFAKQDARTTGFVFKPGVTGELVSSDIDFLEEENRLDSDEHPITSILWVAPEGEADVAFLRVTRASGRPPLPRPIQLAENIAEDMWIAAIGYPARDPSIRDQQLVIRIFGDDVYEKKRLSLGKLKKIEDPGLRHDCSTLGGNSGSVLLDLKTGKAVGLHRAGLLDDSANLGVTAAHLQTLLKNALRRDAPVIEQPPQHTPPQNFNQPVTMSAGSGTYSMRFNIPVEITVSIGAPVGITAAAAGAVLPAPGDAQENGFETVLQSVRGQLGKRPEVLKIRPGYRFKNGWITDERVIVVEVDEKLEYGDLQKSGKSPLPREFMGVGIDVRTASLPDQLEALIGTDLLALERPGKPAGYKEPPGYDNPDSDMFLGRVRERMNAIFHVSPDAGFPNLKAFLERVEQHLTATMYEWEPNHISKVIAEVIRQPGRTLRMVTQKRGVGEGDATERAVVDIEKRLHDKFTHVWASVRGPHRLIPNSYHIKVATRDGKEVWLSSGNWKSSNQPENPAASDVLEDYNREWHAVIENERLATLFQKYIEYDFKQAERFPLEDNEAVAVPDLEFFVPEDALKISLESVPKPTYKKQLKIENEVLDIQPLLTPDRDVQGNRIFMKNAIEMLQRATKKIYIQNQSFSLTEDNNREFDEFFAVLKEKQRALQDVRVIFRDARDYHRPSDIQKQQDLIERLKDFGLNVSPDAIRLQSKCHTKGIIIDSKEVLLGSQNLTNGGSLFNRDASLLVRSSKVAAFYEKIFLYDWQYLAHNEADERVGGIRLAKPDEEAPKGFRRVKLSDLLSNG
ncbi:MAG: phospholipase D-like domain-containing protein [Acidobacteriota bacterium]|nr:phospholipase D-like domain-containing protein [Acidobacteriota bacterium]